MLPFSNLNNEEFLYTGKSKKLKFTNVAPKHVSNKTAFLEDINSASEQDEKTLAKCWLPSEVRQLKNKKTRKMTKKTRKEKCQKEELIRLMIAGLRKSILKFVLLRFHQLLHSVNRVVLL